jgi:cytidylate kinase
MIVTIDGPAGAGKSTAARQLAQRLGFDFLDTGAMYRAVALAAKKAGIDLHAEAQLENLLAELRLEMPAGRVLVNGTDVSGLIRTPEITALSRAVADSKVVRQHLSRLQRQIASGRNLVTEGRDQGTIVFPEAGCKFFLEADDLERARRRWREYQAKGEQKTLEEVLDAQTKRDRLDAARAIAPMVPAADAIILNSTALTLEEVVARMEAEVRRRMDCDAAAKRR